MPLIVCEEKTENFREKAKTQQVHAFRKLHLLLNTNDWLLLRWVARCFGIFSLKRTLSAKPAAWQQSEVRVESAGDRTLDFRCSRATNTRKLICSTKINQVSKQREIRTNKSGVVWIKKMVATGVKELSHRERCYKVKGFFLPFIASSDLPSDMRAGIQISGVQSLIKYFQHITLIQYFFYKKDLLQISCIQH